MARKKGGNSKNKGLCKAIYHMHCVVVRVKDICKHYKMKQSTVSNIIRRQRNDEQNSVRKNMGRPFELSPRGMRLLQKYVVGNCFDPLRTIVAKFNTATDLHLTESTAGRYKRKFIMKNFIAMQKPFLSKKNMCARVIWGRTHKDWTLQQWSNVMLLLCCASCQEFPYGIVDADRIRITSSEILNLDIKASLYGVAFHRVHAVH